MVALCDRKETVKRDQIQHRVKACPPIKTEPVELDNKPSRGPFPLLMHMHNAWIALAMRDYL